MTAVDIYIVQIDYMSVSDILLSTIPLQKSNVILHPQTTCIRFDLSGCVSIKCHLHIYRFIGHKLHFVVRLFSRAIYMKSGLGWFDMHFIVTVHMICTNQPWRILWLGDLFDLAPFFCV